MFLTCGQRALTSSHVRVGWPAFPNQRPVHTMLPTFRTDLARGHIAVKLYRSQSASTCDALSFSARSFRRPGCALGLGGVKCVAVRVTAR